MDDQRRDRPCGIETAPGRAGRAQRHGKGEDAGGAAAVAQLPPEEEPKPEVEERAEGETYFDPATGRMITFPPGSPVGAGRASGWINLRDLPQGDTFLSPSPTTSDNSDTPASAPTGNSSSPIEIQPGTNSPASVGGTDYSGHALDRMQGRGLPPAVVEDTIRNGEAAPGNRPGTTTYWSATNNVTVVVDSATGTVITVRKGAP